MLIWQYLFYLGTILLLLSRFRDVAHVRTVFSSHGSWTDRIVVGEDLVLLIGCLLGAYASFRFDSFGFSVLFVILGALCSTFLKAIRIFLLKELNWVQHGVVVYTFRGKKAQVVACSMALASLAVFCFIFSIVQSSLTLLFTI